MREGSQAYTAEMKRLGIPYQYGALTQVPFDTLSDFFRGTRGAMLDMYRNPDKIMEATEKLLPIMIDIGVKIVGGCCGTSPATIISIKNLIDTL